MKRLRVAVLLLAIGCGSDSVSVAPETKTFVYFKVDAQTCTGAAAIDFFIDGAAIGTETLSAGTESKGYPATPTSHTIGASISNTKARVWGPQVVNLSGLQTYIYLLTCS